MIIAYSETTRSSCDTEGSRAGTADKASVALVQGLTHGCLWVVHGRNSKCLGKGPGALADRALRLYH